MPIAAPIEPNPLGNQPEGDKVAGSAATPSGIVDGKPFEIIHHDWTWLAFGIVLAGSVYAVLLAGTWGAIAFFVVFITKLPEDSSMVMDELAAGVFGVFMYGVALAGVGGVWAGLVSLFVLPLAFVVAWSLKLRGSMTWFGAVVGGLVGFLATTPLMYPLAMEFGRGQMQSWEALDLLLAVAAGPALATVVGQIGGAWGGSHSKRRESRYWAAVRKAQYVPAGSMVERPEGEDDLADTIHPRFQFGIRHMLWMAVWFSVLFSVMRLSGFDLAVALPMLLGWIGFQLLTLSFGGWFAKRFRGWRARRRESLHVKQPVE